MDNYCTDCGCWLNNEKYYVPVSTDEVIILCYDCKMQMSAGEVLHEVDEYDAELMYSMDDGYNNTEDY